jgi:hypothetical protein
VHCRCRRHSRGRAAGAAARLGSAWAFLGRPCPGPAADPESRQSRQSRTCQCAERRWGRRSRRRRRRLPG